MNETQELVTGASYAANVTGSSTIGPYLVLDMIGEGGWATVHRVAHVVSGRLFAMKLARRETPLSASALTAIMINEAQVARSARHASVIDIADIGVTPEGRCFLVMELLSGRSLEDLVEDEGAMVPRRAVRICRQIADALCTVHRSGAAHCDITAGNIFVERDASGENAKLIDFGLARSLRGIDMSCLVPDDMFAGTPDYMSPEQARDAHMDGRSDLYSLGAVLYELLAGEPVFAHDRLSGLLMQHLHAVPPTPESPYGPLPGGLTDVVLRCLEKSPEERFQSANELIVALDAVDWSTCHLARCA